MENMIRIPKIFFLIVLIISSCATVGNEIKRDGRYILLSNGVVRDEKYRLEWLAGPDQDLNWFEAKNWITTTRSKYGGGWRMPSRNELSTLYVKGAGTRNMTPFIISTGWEMWTNETWHKTHAWLYSFLEGKTKSIWMTLLSFFDTLSVMVASFPG